MGGMLAAAAAKARLNQVMAGPIQIMEPCIGAPS